MEVTPAPELRTGDDRPVVQSVDPVKARRVIWIFLLIFAGLQAWAARFSAPPDGVSYVDLSE